MVDDNRRREKAKEKFHAEENLEGSREGKGREREESVGRERERIRWDPQPPGVILLDDKTGVRGQVLLTPLISSALHAAEYRAQKRELSKYPGWLRSLRQKERRSIPA